MRKWLVSFLTLLATALAAGPAQASAINSIVFFGDSLSDTGNVWYATGGSLPSAPYYQGSNGGPPDFTGGQWSDWLGPSWSTVFASKLGLTATPSLVPGGNNFAWGGARTGVNPDATGVPYLTQQVGQYLAGGAPTATTLYSIMIGGNDIANNLTDPGIIGPAIGSILAQIQAIYSAGGRQFLVSNVPDIGATPLFLGLGAQASAGATAFTLAWNATLAAALGQLNLPGADIDLFDFFGLAKNPAFLAQFTNLTEPCLTQTSVCADPTQYAYSDVFHPSSHSHQLIAAGAAAAVGIPEPGTLLLILVAGVAVARSRRAQR
jgi:phospholipase/lecithinase/hemolysin